MSGTMTRPNVIANENLNSPTQMLKHYKIELVRHALKNFRDKTPNQNLIGVEMLRELRSDKTLASH